MTTNTPKTTKAAPKTKGETLKPEGEGTKLVENPEDMSAKEIKEVSKDDGSTKPENEANADMAEHLKETKKKSDDEDRGYFGGQGGAAGI